MCISACCILFPRVSYSQIPGKSNDSEPVDAREARFERIAAMWRVNPSNGAAIAKREIGNALKANDSLSIAYCFYALGINQWALGQNVEAARSYLRSIDVAQRIHNQPLLAKSYNNLGLLYYSLGTYEDAKIWFLRSLRLRMRMADSSGIGRVMMNLGMVARRVSTLDSARALFSNALRLLSKAGDSVNIARGRHYMGETFAAQNNHGEAILWYERSQEVFRVVPDRMGHALVLVDFAKSFLQLRNTDKAGRYAADALLRGESMHAPFVIHESAKVMHSILARKGDFAAAYKMFEFADRFSDSLRNESTLNAIARMKLQHLLEQQQRRTAEENRRREERNSQTLEKERSMLKLMIAGLIVTSVLVVGLWFGLRHVRKVGLVISENNREIELMNQKLRRIDESRDKLFSIIGHDLSAPMGTIVGSAELLLERQDDLTHAEQIQLLGAIGESAKASHLTLENLLTWTRSRYGDLSFNPTENDLDLVIEQELRLAIPMAKQKNITLSAEGRNGIRGIFDNHMISSVLRNLIMNALKFTGAGGSVTIATACPNGSVILSVRDTGIGISKDRLEALNNRTGFASTAGTLGETGTGLGLEICREFLDRHNGLLRVESVEGEGSTFTAEFASILRSEIASPENVSSGL